MMKPKLRALICDLDGTLVDSEPNYRKADIRFLDSYGVSMTEPEWDGVIGMGSEAFISMVRERFAIDRPIDVLLREKNESYLEIARGATFAFPEVATFVAEARGALPCMAVASGSSLEIIRMSLESSGLAAYFDVLVSAEEVPRGKPAPDIFLEAARRLGVHPDECLVLEDSVPGVLAAENAGMLCAVMPAPQLAGRTEFERARYHFARGMADFSSAKLLDLLQADGIWPEKVLS